MKADDGHFEYQRIVYFVVQITTDFLCHVTKYDASFFRQTFRALRGHPRNLITLSQLKIIQCCLAFYVIMNE